MADVVEFIDKAAYDTWETAQQVALGMPITATNKATNLPRPDLPQTIRYTNAIEHPEKDTGNNLVIAYFESNGDLTGQTVISENKAKTKGFFVEDTSLPFGVLEASGAVAAQKVGLLFTIFNQFDTETKARGITVNAASNRITIQSKAQYEIEYFIKFAGDNKVTYNAILTNNNVEQKESFSFATYEGTEVELAGKIAISEDPGAVIELRISCDQASANFNASDANLIANEIEDPNALSVSAPESPVRS